MTISLPAMRSATVVLALAFASGRSQADDAEDKAVQAVQRWTKQIERDDKMAGKPVVMLHLSGAGLAKADTGVTDTVLKDLRGLTNLRNLVLTQTNITDSGLRELANLKSLKGLHLETNRVSDAGLKELDGLKNLEDLYVDGNEITDAGLRQLKELKHLRTLSLSDTQITDAGLKELKAIRGSNSLAWKTRPLPMPG